MLYTCFNIVENFPVLITNIRIQRWAKTKLPNKGNNKITEL